VDKQKFQEKINKLKKLAEDQKGTPEGDLAEQIIEKILKQYPDLQVEDIKIIQWQHKFKDEYQFQLWILASKAHNIKLVKFNADDPLECISEGNEVDMFITKNEWEYSCNTFNKMAIQVLRGIVNKLWPQICKNPDEITDFEESEYRDFAENARDKTTPQRKAINEHNDKG